MKNQKSDRNLFFISFLLMHVRVAQTDAMQRASCSEDIKIAVRTSSSTSIKTYLDQFAAYKYTSQFYTKHTSLILPFHISLNVYRWCILICV